MILLVSDSMRADRSKMRFFRFPGISVISPLCELAYHLFFLTFLMGIMNLLPRILRGQAARALHRLCQFGSETDPGDLLDSCARWGSVKGLVRMHLREAVRGYVSVGQKVPNIKLVHMRQSDEEQCRLLDFMQAGRPLVLNMGSCT